MSDNLERPIDQGVYMIASTVALFACLYLKQIQDPTSRKIFSTIAGFTIHVYVFGMGALASVSMNLLCYFLLCTFPQRKQHIPVALIGFITLSLSQIHKQIYLYGVNGLDVPMNLMFNYCRVSSLAFCLRDGAVIKEAKGKDVDLKSREKVYAVQEVPSLFDFMAYLYYCGAAISGPFYEYKDFVDHIQ